ncbi:transposase [Nonomuraea sp. MTCD27]|uniref:transposase n=1 Tax=Nonomuraea sp. MTCD27 TaxID=1676747 RepID=UPI0035BF022A
MAGHRCTQSDPGSPRRRPHRTDHPAWHDRYALRCGIEATIHQAVTVIVTGLRRARYRGIKKVHPEPVVSAIVVNLIRLDAWWNGHPLQRKRTSHVARPGPTLTT